jgi:hypothetical protein
MTTSASKMKTSDFGTALQVEQTPMQVFNAINNVRGWWQGDITGNTETLHDEFTYGMGEIHFSKQVIVDMIPGKKVVWLVTDSKLSFAKNKSEWTGTKISFEISRQKDKTQIRFTHIGLVPELEVYGGCSNAWKQLIQESLFSLITTGKGVNVF